ncbi:hypothetical protein RIF29_40475 [Crotalaria pallida]|uniref:Pentatricopeptide repeat protein n=1 Tax=Crotalaria pallida TaxID=3830 RepID=A0AAN9HRQ8_CROPI
MSLSPILRSLPSKSLIPSLPLANLLLRSLSTSPAPNQNPSPTLPHITKTKTQTPLQKQFDTWTQHLKPGFTPSDVDRALKSQPDPDLALDIFRWTSHHRSYRHTSLTYLTIIKILVAARRYRHAETLIEEVIAGACDPTLPLYNSIVRFCCGRKLLFSRAFDVYNKMLRSENCKPTLETYTLLFNSLLRRFSKLNVCYVYLHSVRSLTKQMKASGVIPDIFVLNMIIKAYSKCLEVDEAIRVFREMGLYGCEPNGYSYGYIAQGLCEKGRVKQGFGFYREMRSKGFVPSSSTFVIVICTLALDRRSEDAIEVMFDMLGNSRSPDHLTYKTVLEGLCREGRADEAFDLLDECRKKDVSLGDKMYKTLLNDLHYISRE